MEHCMSQWSYEQTQKRDHQIELNYIADCIRIMTENTARAVKDGSYIGVRLSELGKKAQKEETPDGDAIARDIIRRMGLKANSKQRG